MLIIDESNDRNNEKIGGDPRMINGTPEWKECHSEEAGSIDQIESNPLLKGDAVNHPDHYNSGSVECIDAIESALGEEGFESWLVGTIIKYLWRYKHKNGYEDIQKAKWYMDELAGLKDDPKSHSKGFHLTSKDYLKHIERLRKTPLRNDWKDSIINYCKKE